MDLDSLEVGGVVFSRGRGRDTFYPDFRLVLFLIYHILFPYYQSYCNVRSTLANPNFLLVLITDFFRSGSLTAFIITQTPQSTIAIMEDLVESLAQKFSLTSKEEGDVEAGSGSMGAEFVTRKQWCLRR